jgi:hypothetical protein
MRIISKQAFRCNPAGIRVSAYNKYWLKYIPACIDEGHVYIIKPVQ